MKIIVVTGTSNIGKTTVLTIAYSNLIALQAEQISSPVVLGDPKQKDFEISLNWMGKWIAFFTMGDFEKDLIDAAAKYQAKGFDILICACNTQFPNVLVAFSAYTCCHVVPKVDEQDLALQQVVNKLIASTIVSLI